MSETEIRDKGTDNYIVLSQYDASSNLEVAITQALVQSAYDKKVFNPSNDIYTCAANDSSWNTIFINNTYPSYVNTSAISNYPNGTLPEYSVISSVLSTSDVSINSYTTNISSNQCNNNSYTFESLPSTSSYYDSNYVFTQNLIANCSDNQSGTYVNATFDVDASNAKIQYAMQSRWNTTLGPYNGLQTVGPDPTAMTQDISFNMSSAFAKHGSDTIYQSHWFSVDASDGSLTPYLFDASYQPILNNLLIRDRDMSGVTLNIYDDVGVFRIQQRSNVITTKVSLDDSSFNQILTNDLNNMPLFNGNQLTSIVNESKTSLPIPGDMSSIQFQSLLDEDVYNTVAENWSFQIDVSSNNNSGYNINEKHPLISDLNNSNLLDNPFYMQYYVSNDHSITFDHSYIKIFCGTDVNDLSSVDFSVDFSSITIDLSSGETLTHLHAGLDGSIIINPNNIYTRYTDLSNVDLSENFIPLVAYVDDRESSLSNDEMTNQYFKGMWQKVAQQSSVTSPDYWLKTDASAIMTLYTEGSGIVDNLYSASDFDFSFNNTFGETSDIHLWKINCTNNIIVNSSSFFTDASYTILNNYISTAGLLSEVTDIDDVSYNNYRIFLTAKTKEEIGLYKAVTDVSGWTLSYSDNSDNFLHSDAIQAFSSKAFPIYDPSLISELNDGMDLNFSYTYKSVLDSKNAGGLVDYIDISYNSNVVKINQTDITHIYDVSYSNTTVQVIPDASYNFTSSILNKNNYELVYVNSNNRYDASFFANYGPFTNIRLTIHNILQNNRFYRIRNKKNGTFSPHSILKYVNSSYISNINIIDENITPSTGNSLSISGKFTANDLKPYYSITQGKKNQDSSWTNIGVSNDTDVYYGLENKENVFSSGKLVTYINYNPFDETLNISNHKLNLYNYYIPFIYNDSYNTFTIEYFTSSTDNDSLDSLSSTSFLGKTNYLTLTNGYNNVKSWSNDKYNVTLSHTQSTNTFIVKKLPDNQTQFTITLLNNTSFLGTFIVSYIPKDYYRVERLLGENEFENNYSESFLTTNYDGGEVNLSPTLQGVFIGSEKFSLSSTHCPQLGNYQSFRVIGDYMNINEVGTTTDPSFDEELGISSYNGGSLSFQYVSPDKVNYSAVFTFPKYRGYKDKFYLIHREPTSVIFNISGSILSKYYFNVLKNTLTHNMYYGQQFNVNNLTYNSDIFTDPSGAAERKIALGVTGSFYYSIPPSNSLLIYPVTVTGDTVNVYIKNPNYIGKNSNITVPSGATIVNDPKLYSNSMTLKDYGQNGIYTFSGNWYNTDKLMAIRPSRVKLNNIAYPYNKLSYQIKLLPDTVNLYKAKTEQHTGNWLGNPSIKGSQDPDSQDLDIIPSDTDWHLMKKYLISDLYNGINIGKKVIYQNPEVSFNKRIVYIVSTPPYYKFEQTSTESCPVIPYDASSQYLSNKKQIYMPYIHYNNSSLRSIFNPFSESTSYVDINKNSILVKNDINYLNNVTFTLGSAPSITDAVKNPDNRRYGIIVPGTNLTVTLYTGLYNETNTGNHTNPIWSGPVTSIPSTPTILNNALIFRERDASGSILFSALQYPADIGYTYGVAGYKEIFKSDVSSNWYNIDFKMGNSSWFNNNTQITYFNTQSHGIKPTLYTVVDINNVLNQNNKRRVYKYITPSTIDIDIISGAKSGYETFNITFSSRYYHDYDISKNNVFPYASDSIWKYNDLLYNTVIPNTSISWTLDTSFADIAYVSWAFGNSITAKNMLIELFWVQKEQQKWGYIHLEPFMRYLNQFNMQVGSVAWDGTVTTPLIKTNVVRLAPLLKEPLLLNNTYATQQYSESKL